MKLKKICLAVASALAAGAATQAPALTLEQFDGTTINAFTSGSTALDGAIRAYMRYVCVGGVDEFQATVTQPVTPGIYANNNVLQSGYFCTLSSSSSVVTNATLRGKKILLRKSSGDSGEGVVVGGGALTINFLANPAVTNSSVTNSVSNYTCSAGSSSAASGSLGTIQQWTCTAGTAASSTGVSGFADVEFSLLNQLITPKLTSTQLGNLQNAQIAANVWGIAVSKNLYTALQTLQGISASGSAADSEANMPSLDKEVLNALFTGVDSDWSALTNISGTAIAAPSSADSGVYLARRPDSSGTQTSISVMLLNFPCVGSASAMLTDNTGGVCGTATPGSTSVTVNQGTGGLLSCLGTLNTAGKYGIGFASTSNRPVSTSGTTVTDNGWRYVKVNGVAPTLFNASTGRYDLLTEAILGYEKTGVTAPTGDAKLMFDEMGVQLGQPSVLAAVNGGAATQNYAATTWFAGVMTPGSNTLFSPTFPLTISGVSANPVLPSTRSFNGPNSCQPLQRFGASIPVSSN
jgi:hypothetical protein